MDVAAQVRDVLLATDDQRAEMFAVHSRMLFRKTAVQARVTLAAHHDPAHRLRPPTVVEQHLGQDCALEASLDEADPQVPVFATVAHRLIEAADRLERAAAHERGAVDRVHVEESGQIAPGRRPVPRLVAEGP